jgi:hypothetical protein
MRMESILGPSTPIFAYFPTLFKKMTYALQQGTDTVIFGSRRDSTGEAMRDFPVFFILATTALTSLVWLLKVMPTFVR